VHGIGFMTWPRRIFGQFRRSVVCVAWVMDSRDCLARG